MNKRWGHPILRWNFQERGLVSAALDMDPKLVSEGNEERPRSAGSKQIGQEVGRVLGVPLESIISVHVHDAEVLSIAVRPLHQGPHTFTCIHSKCSILEQPEHFVL